MIGTTNRSIIVTISNQTGDSTVDESRLRSAVRHVLESNAIHTAIVGVAVLSDESIRRLNRDFLQHDNATDVLSFPLTMDCETLEGDIAISLDTATARAKDYDWEVADELLLYVIHGALHLVGYRDKSESSIAEMRAQEVAMLAHFGLRPRYHDPVISS